MVHVTAAVVADGSANVFGHFVDLSEQFLNRKLLKIRVPFESFVEVRDVRTMMLVVVNLHRFCVDVRLERVESVRQRRQRESHLGSSSLSRSGGH
jgi:uncharacterized protein YqgV (UPF0045/DUF77 family)